METLIKEEIQVLAEGLRFPEGPAFAPDGSLWLVELKGESLVRLKNGALNRFCVGGGPNGIAIETEGKIWFCDSVNNEIRRFDPETGETRTMAAHLGNEPLNQPNDLAFDGKGNLVFTCPGNSRKEPTGYVCVLDKNDQVKIIAYHLFFPNGLAFNAEGDKLYIAETYHHRVWVGDWDAENLTWNNPEVFADIKGPEGPGGPDGMALDQQGNLYVAVYGTGKIAVIDAEGHLTEEISLPGQNPTNCAFDVDGDLGLVVTEAEQGKLLSIKTDKRGLALLNRN